MVTAVVRQQILMGTAIARFFLYRNPFGANQGLALTRKSFRIAQVSHFAVQQWTIVLQWWVWHHACCVYRFTVCCVHWIIICWTLNCESVILWLGRPVSWKPMCLLSTPEGLATLNYQLNIDYLNFQPKSSTFSKKFIQNIRSFKWTAHFVLHILKAMTALCCVPQCTSKYFSVFIINAIVFREVSFLLGGVLPKIGGIRYFFLDQKGDQNIFF